MIDKNSPSVAIVDDEEDLVKILKMLLTKRGITVSFVAYDGLEAIDRYNKAEKKPDVILIDHRMRVINGIDAMKLILRDNGNTKFIFLTADKHVEKEAMEAGAVAFLDKPASINKIIDTIQEFGKS